MTTPTTTISSIVPRDRFLRGLDKALHHGMTPLAVALTDIDAFEAINDNYGYESGNAVLSAWEAVLRANLPEGASVNRLGGDEYAIVLPAVTAETAVVLLQEIRTHFSALEIEGVGSSVEVTVGIAANPPHGDTGEDLWRAAAAALMRAKRDGGDRISIYVEEKMTLKSNYYTRAGLDKLAKLSGATSRTEASLLREALDDLLDKYSAAL